MSTPDTRLSGLRNIGPITERWLHAVGIHTKEDIKDVGPVAIYKLLKGHGYNVSLNLVYALHGAITDQAWNKLPAAVKARLKTQVESS